MFSQRWSQILGAIAGCAVLIAANSLGYLELPKGILFRVTQPVVRPVTIASQSVKDFWIALFSIRSQLQQRSELEIRYNRAQTEIAALLHQQEENRTLRTFLSLKQSSPFTSVAATVVARDPSGISGNYIIDRGSLNGLSRGDAVLDQAGSLLGILREVYPHTAEFLLVTDGQIKIDASVVNRDTLGIVTGSHALGLNLDLVSQEARLEKGDRVVTSGLTGALPSGILVGTIDEQQSSNSELFQKLSVIPAARVKDFKYVLVVIGF